MAAARRYLHVQDFKEGDPKAYMAAASRVRRSGGEGVDFFAHMSRKPVFKYTDSDLRERIQKHATYSSFCADTNLHSLAGTRGLMEFAREVLPAADTAEDKFRQWVVASGSPDVDYSTLGWANSVSAVHLRCKTHDHWYTNLPHNHIQRVEAGTTGCPKCRKTGKSVGESEIADFVRGLGLFVQQHAWIGRKELDVYIPNLNVGVEYNGLYWHSAQAGKSRAFHQEKTDHFFAHGIRVLHVFSDEWETQRPWVEDYLRRQLGIAAPNRVGARQCESVSVDAADVREFFADHHLGGYAGGSPVALKYEGEVVAAATFVSTPGDEVELSRWCVRRGWAVPGGLSKAIAHIQQPITTWVDTAKFSGAGFKAAGFVEVKHTYPTYWYTDGFTRKNRRGFQKAALREVPEASGRTEKELAASIGWHQIGGCRQLLLQRPALT